MEMANDWQQFTEKKALKDVVLQVEGDEGLVEIPIRVREMPWAKRNQILSSCMNVDGQGGGKFDGATYINECLKYIIAEAPWGRTTEVFLQSIVDDRFGKALEMLVPKVTQSQEDVSVDMVKKE